MADVLGAPAQTTPQPVQPQEGVQPQTDTQPAQPQQNQGDVPFTSLPAQDQEMITAYTKYFGAPKKGQEIIMHQGKPCLLTNINGKPMVRSLQDIFDNYSMAESANDTFLANKVAQKRLEDERTQMGELLNSLFTEPEVFWDLLRNKGYSDMQINEIAKRQIERAIKYADSPKEIRELEELKRKNATLEKQARDAEERQKQYEYKQKEEQQYQTIKKDILKVMTENNLLDNEDVAEDIILSVASQIKFAAQNNVNLSAQDALKLVLNKVPGFMAIHYGNLSAQTIRKMLLQSLGQEKFKKVMDATIETTQSGTPPTSAGFRGSQPGPTKKKGKEQPRKKTFGEFFNP